MSENKIVLYYADWCPHCKSVKPGSAIWEDLKKLSNKHNIKLEAYEEKEIPNNVDVNGFPTFMAYVDKVGKEVNSKDPQTIVDYFKKLVGMNKSGGAYKHQKYKSAHHHQMHGGDKDEYYQKYKKYKNKYLNLKKMVNRT